MSKTNERLKNKKANKLYSMICNQKKFNTANDLLLIKSLFKPKIEKIDVVFKKIPIKFTVKIEVKWIPNDSKNEKLKKISEALSTVDIVKFNLYRVRRKILGRLLFTVIFAIMAFSVSYMIYILVAISLIDCLLYIYKYIRLRFALSVIKSYIESDLINN